MFLVLSYCCVNVNNNNDYVGNVRHLRTSVHRNISRCFFRICSLSVAFLWGDTHHQYRPPPALPHHPAYEKKKFFRFLFIKSYALFLYVCNVVFSSIYFSQFLSVFHVFFGFSLLFVYIAYVVVGRWYKLIFSFYFFLSLK